MSVKGRRRKKVSTLRFKRSNLSLPLIPTLSLHATSSLLIALGGLLLLISTLPSNIGEEGVTARVLGGCALLIFMLIVCFKVYRKNNTNFWSLSALTISSIALMIDRHTAPGVLLVICGAITALLPNIAPYPLVTEAETTSTTGDIKIGSSLNTVKLLNEYRILVDLIERLGNSYRSGEIDEYEYKELFEDYITRLDKLKSKIKETLINLEKYRGTLKRKLSAINREISLVKARKKIGEITQEEAARRKEYLEKEKVKLMALIRETEEKIAYLRENLNIPLLSIEEMYNKLVSYYSNIYNKPGVVVEREILKLVKEGFNREDAVRILYQRIFQEELE